MSAAMRVEIGPCDDDAFLYINGRYTVHTRLGEVRTFQRSVEDGNFDVRLLVVNSGGWAWRAKLRLLIAGQEVVAIDEDGGSGFYTGSVYDKSWQFKIQGGKFTDFL